MAKKTEYFVEMTDLFCGEANYSWARRYKIRASSMRGVAQIMSRMYGIQWHFVGQYDGLVRYDSKSRLTCFFVDTWEEDTHSHYRYEVIN